MGKHPASCTCPPVFRRGVLFMYLVAISHAQSPRPAVWDRVEVLGGTVCAALSLDDHTTALLGNPGAVAPTPLDFGLALLFPGNAPAGSEWILLFGDARVQLGSNSRHHLSVGALWEDGGSWASYDAQARYLGDRLNQWGAGMVGWAWRGEGPVALGASALMCADPDQAGGANLAFRGAATVFSPGSRFAGHFVVESPWLGRTVLRPHFLSGIGFSLIPELRFGAEARFAPDEDPELRLGFRFRPFPLLNLGASLGIPPGGEPWWQLGMALFLGKMEIYLAHGAGGGRYEVNEVGIRHGL